MWFKCTVSAFKVVTVVVVVVVVVIVVVLKICGLNILSQLS